MSGGMPSPSSLTATDSRPSPTGRAVTFTTVEGLAYFRALSIRFWNNRW